MPVKLRSERVFLEHWYTLNNLCYSHFTGNSCNKVECSKFQNVKQVRSNTCFSPQVKTKKSCHHQRSGQNFVVRLYHTRRLFGNQRKHKTLYEKAQSCFWQSLQLFFDEFVNL